MDLERLPKVEHHCHLEACFSATTLREVAAELGLDVPADEDTFRRDWLITEPVSNLEDALRKLANIQSIWATAEIIERLTYEACEYACAQGVRIMEFRYSPDFIAGGHPQLDFEIIHRAILAGLQRARSLPVAIGLIGIVQKILPPQKAAYTADFIIENRDSFVGIDLADMDIGFEIRRFAALMTKARAAGLRITCHAGEDDVPEAPAHVRVAIDELGAERIGHGVHILKDPAMVDYVRDKNILLELCPTSNWLTSTVATTAAHPIRRLVDAGVHVSINSDDPGIFAIDLCHEYELLHAEHGFDEPLFNRCNDIAAAHSFLPDEQKRAVWPRPIPGL